MTIKDFFYSKTFAGKTGFTYWRCPKNEEDMTNNFDDSPSRLLPHSLAAQYHLCELCACPSTVLFREEIKGSDYRLCAQCREDNLWQIRDAMAEDMAGADASEADQEEK